MTRCFVIGPIGNKFAPPGSSGREHYEDALQVYEYVILPACKKHGIEPVRADGIAKSGEITDQIFRHLAEDEVVIADVSGGNPNVMYELGLRHTTGLLTIQIGEYGQLPFDVTAVRTIQFSRSERGLIDARKALEEALEVGLAEGGDPVTATKAFADRQVASVAALHDSDAEGEPGGTSAETIDDDLDAEGFVEQMAALEEVFPLMTDRVESIGTTLEELGTEAQDMSGQFDLLNAGGAPMAARLTAIRHFSGRIQPHADALTAATTAFAKDMSKIDSSVRGVFEYIEENEDVDSEEIGEYLESVIGMAGSAREGMEGLNEFSGIVRGLGKISKTLRRPGKQMAAALDAMATSVAVMDEWEAWALRLQRKAAAKAASAPAGGDA